MVSRNVFRLLCSEELVDHPRTRIDGRAICVIRLAMDHKASTQQQVRIALRNIFRRAPRNVTLAVVAEYFPGGPPLAQPNPPDQNVEVKVVIVDDNELIDLTGISESEDDGNDGFSGDECDDGEESDYGEEAEDDFESSDDEDDEDADEDQVGADGFEDNDAEESDGEGMSYKIDHVSRWRFKDDGTKQGLVHWSPSWEDARNFASHDRIRFDAEQRVERATRRN